MAKFSTTEQVAGATFETKQKQARRRMKHAGRVLGSTGHVKGPARSLSIVDTFKAMKRAAKKEAAK